MGLFDFFRKRAVVPQSVAPDYFFAGDWMPIETFDGEKTSGELGIAKDVMPDYKSLRYRSYEAYLKDDIIVGIANKFFKFVIGNGLRLKSEVQTDVLESEGVSFNENFRDLVESRFKVYASSRYADYSGMVNLHAKATEAFTSAFLGGDCLVICRVENNIPNIQVIEGQRVKQPSIDEVSNSKNKISNGVEYDKRGNHVAFWIDGTERIEARGKKTGRLMAWMVYFSKHRIDHVRGIPAMTPILEKVKKIGRYSEAIVGSAEERAKIAYSIEHDQHSTGESPLKDRIINKVAGVGVDEVNSFAKGEIMASKIVETTGKQTFNMPIGSKLTSLESKQESVFGDFFDVVLGQICSTLDLPPEVAKQLYSSNYSASRAAIKTWEYVNEIIREKFAEQFYKRIYSIWLETEILKNKVDAPGYLEAVQSGNFMVVESYAYCRFVGKNMPHIDPVKEITAVRKMLGNDDVPLISAEDATEILGVGDWWENISKVKKTEEEYVIKE